MIAKKIGVLGCGMIAELGHLPALKHVAGIDLHAVYDVSWNRALAMQAKFQIQHAFPTEKAFWESDIDAVVICTPAPFHPGNVLQAAQYKKHVLCEKPVAMNEADITRMIRTMEEAGLMLFTGFNCRFSSSAKEIHRLATEEAMRDRERTSQDHPSTMARAVSTVTSDVECPLDLEEPDDLPPSTLSTFFERTRQ